MERQHNTIRGETPVTLLRDAGWNYSLERNAWCDPITGEWISTSDLHHILQDLELLSNATPKPCILPKENVEDIRSAVNTKNTKLDADLVDLDTMNEHFPHWRNIDISKRFVPTWNEWYLDTLTCLDLGRQCDRCPIKLNMGRSWDSRQGEKCYAPVTVQSLLNNRVSVSKIGF